jgi:hypothetical protein
MPCAGKGSSGCSCTGFQPKDSQDEPSKCKRCKHRKKYHTAAPDVSTVLAQYDLARLQSKKVSEEQARRETNKGFHRGKNKEADNKKGTAASKSGSSKVRDIFPSSQSLTTA